jgi:3-oxoadipate enol-lactonase
VPTIGRSSYLEAAPRPSTDPARAVERAGRTLVLLHAFPLTARMWEPQFALAEEGWRVIAPHLGPIPRTSGTGPTMDDYAGGVIDLLDALHVHEAVIAGLSMGGYAALALFRHAPRYAQGLILCDTRAEADTPQAVESRKTMQLLLRDKGQAAIADEMLPKLLGETTRRTRPEIVDRVRALVLSNASESIDGALNALMTRPDSTALLSSIRCPTLVIVGEEDTVTPRALSEKLQQGISGAELAVIAEAGHLSSFEQPVVFNQTVARFLAHRV